MKKVFLAALAVTLGLASCSNDDDAGIKNAQNAVVNLKISADTFTRGVFDNIDESSEVQSAVTVSDKLYIFIAQGANLVVNDEMTPATSKSITQANTGSESGKNLTTAVDKVIILGNLPTGIDLSTVTTVAGLQAVVKSLEDAQNDYFATTPKIWVQGESNIAWGVAGSDGVVPGNAAISLHPVLSRIDAEIKFQLTGQDAAVGIYASKGDFDGRSDQDKGGVVVENVAILYSANESGLVTPFTPTTPTKTVLNSGMIPSGGAWEQGKSGIATILPFNSSLTKETFLFAEWNGTEWLSATNKNNTDGTTNYESGVFKRSFYAFSPKNYEAGNTNISVTPNYKAYTMLTIKGTQYDKNGGVMTPRYFSVKFAPKLTVEDGDTDAELEPGQRYHVTVNFKGDFTNGGGGGTTPEEKGSAKLDITIEPAKWKAVIDIDKDFTGK